MKISKKLIKIIASVALCAGSMFMLTACGDAENFALNIRQSTFGLPLTIATYDFEGQKIDQIKTNKAYIHTDDNMSKKNSDGDEQSSVIDIDYGKNRSIHVGSTLLAWEGIKNYSDIYNHEHVNVNTKNKNDKSIPFVNRFYNNFKNSWGGNGTVVFIKSQSGAPIGAFYGKHVSIHRTKVKNATDFVINGHRLFCYRCNYTTYPVHVLKSMAQNKKADLNKGSEKITTKDDTKNILDKFK